VYESSYAKSSKSNLPADAIVPRKDYCSIAEIRGLSFSFHSPDEKEKALIAWFERNIENCSIQNLEFIRVNKGNWFGTADTYKITYLIEYFLERSSGLINVPISQVKKGNLFSFDNPLAAAPYCMISEVKFIGLSAIDSTTRAAWLDNWFRANQPYCIEKKLSIIINTVPTAWLHS